MVVRHIIVWDILTFNGIIHALASPLLAPPQPVSWGFGETQPQEQGTTLARSSTSSLFAAGRGGT